MWGGIHLINGYSPILPSGVAREFAFAIHGELQEWKGEDLVRSQAGPDGELARLGVDGIIVASELRLDPKPDSEWLLVYTSGRRARFPSTRRAASRVFVRRGRLSLDQTNSFPLQKSHASSTGGTGFLADVAVPPDGNPALLTISRP